MTLTIKNEKILNKELCTANSIELKQVKWKIYPLVLEQKVTKTHNYSSHK